MHTRTEMGHKTSFDFLLENIVFTVVTVHNGKTLH